MENAKQEAYNNAMHEVERIIFQKEDIISAYVRASNMLSVEADADNNDYEYEYAKALTDALAGLIVHQAVKEKGYFINTNDTFHRWEKLQ